MRINATEFVSLYIFDKKYREICFFVTEMCRLHPKETFVLSMLEGFCYIESITSGFRITFWFVDDDLTKITIIKFKFACYDYFIRGENNPLNISIIDTKQKTVLDSLLEYFSHTSVVDISYLTTHLSEEYHIS